MPLTESSRTARRPVSLVGLFATAGLLGALLGGFEGLLSLAFGVEAYGQSAVTRRLKLDTTIVPYAMYFDALVWMMVALALLIVGFLVFLVVAKAKGGSGAPGGRSAGERARGSVLPILGIVTIVAAGFALGLKLRATGRLESLASVSGLLLLGGTAALAVFFVAVVRRGGRRPLEALASRPRSAGVVLAGVLVATIGTVIAASRGARPSTRLPYASELDRGGRPNILFVVLDTVRADHCSAYGHTAPTTPNMEALAAEGTLFENAISPAIWTVAGHASMFTGLYPGAHKADRERPILTPEFRTLAERLTESGYASAAISGNPWVSPDNGIARGFETFSRKMTGQPMAVRQRDQMVVRYFVRIVRPNPEEPQPEVDAEDVAIEAKDWLERRRGDRRPFFLFVNFFDAHWPYEPSGERLKEFVPADATPEEIERLGNLPESEVEFGTTKLDEREQRIVRGLYDGDLARADHGLGLMLERLRADGLLESTVVVVTSDHGEMLGEHGKHGHDLAIYQPLLHVPLVVRWPARFAAGKRETRLVQTHDIYPTLLDLAGLPQDAAERTGAGPQPAAESPCRPLFAETLDAAPRTLAFSDESRPLTTLARLGETFPGRDFSAYDREMRAVTDGRWKAIVTTDGEKHLYDLSVDPGEDNDLAAVAPERLAPLAAAIEARRLIEAAGHTGAPGGGNLENLPPEMLDQLRSLGYIK